MASVLSTVTPFFWPDTVTRTQCPVTVTVFPMPDTVTSLSVQATVRVLPMPLMVMGLAADAVGVVGIEVGEADGVLLAVTVVAVTVDGSGVFVVAVVWVVLLAEVVGGESGESSASSRTAAYPPPPSRIRATNATGISTAGFS